LAKGKNKIGQFKLESNKTMLQLALDMTDIDKALEIVDKVSSCFEILEVGTPLILSEGVRAIKILRARYPQKIILADMKIADAGDYEATIAYEAGADLVTVLGVVDFRTIQGAVAAGNRMGRGVCVDTLNMDYSTDFIIRLENLGVAYGLLHASTDAVYGATTLAPRISEAVKHSKIPLAIAGGITPQNIGPLINSGATIFVIGSSVTRAADPLQTAQILRNQLFGR
jgi:3-hexulose-6-phosphate synthase